MKFQASCSSRKQSFLYLRVNLIQDDARIGSRVVAKIVGVILMVFEDITDFYVLFIPAERIQSGAQIVEPNTVEKEWDGVDDRVEECADDSRHSDAINRIFLVFDDVVA